MEAIFDLIGDVGVPIAMALVMGVFIFLIIITSKHKLEKKKIDKFEK